MLKGFQPLQKVCLQMPFIFADVTKLPPVCLHSIIGPEQNTEEATKTPNSLLFKYFLDSIEELHDRIITLNDTECEELVMLIKQRDRDTTK